MVFGFMAGKDSARVPVALLVGRAQYVSIHHYPGFERKSVKLM